MRFDVSCSALSSRLQSISKVIASKNSLPILDNFLFNLEGDTLTITAADSETRLTATVPVMNAQGSGVFALSAKNILDPLKELPEQPLTFSRMENIISSEQEVTHIHSNVLCLPILSHSI